MYTSIVIILVVAGFAVGLAGGAIAAYHLLVAWAWVEVAVAETARTTGTFWI